MLNLIYLLLVFNEGSKLVLNSAEIEIMDRQIWNSKIQFGDNFAYIVLIAHPNRKQGLLIYKITKTDSRKLFETTPRENIYVALYTYFSKKDNALYMGDAFTGLIYSFKNDSKIEKIRKSMFKHTMFEYKNNLYIASTDPASPINILNKELVSAYPKIGDKIVDKLVHEADKYLTSNFLMSAVLGDKLYLTSSYSNKMLVFSLKTGLFLEEYPLKSVFKNYKALPDHVNMPSGQKEMERYMDEWEYQGYRIMRLDVYNNAIYGFFITDLYMEGIWARLDKKGFVYDNSKEKIKLFALGEKNTLAGKYTTNKSGDLTWELWLDSSLPSP